MSISSFRIFVLVTLVAVCIAVSYIAKTDITLAFSTVGFVLAADWWAQAMFVKLALKQQKGENNANTGTDGES